MAVSPFRFSAAAFSAPSGAQWTDRARQIQDLGYATLLIGDHIGSGMFGPFTALAAAAAATTTLMIVGLNEWYRLMRGICAARTRETYMAVLGPWFGFLTEHGYQWNARPEAVREYTRLFLIEAGCALRPGRVDGWFIQATNRSPISSSGLHLLIAALRSFYSVMLRRADDRRTSKTRHLR